MQEEEKVLCLVSEIQVTEKFRRIENSEEQTEKIILQKEIKFREEVSWRGRKKGNRNI